MQIFKKKYAKMEHFDRNAPYILFKKVRLADILFKNRHYHTLHNAITIWIRMNTIF
jgi:hypothetical protein